MVINIGPDMPVWSIVVWYVRPIAPVAYPTQVTVAHDAVPGNKKPIYIFKLIYTKEHERYQLHVETINIYCWSIAHEWASS